MTGTPIAAGEVKVGQLVNLFGFVVRVYWAYTKGITTAIAGIQHEPGEVGDGRPYAATVFPSDQVQLLEES